ncbi:MAG: ABC transporter ATP-binding protein [Candidatus Delongbacteria bacterium]
MVLSVEQLEVPVSPDFVLHDVDFHLPAGSRLALIGPNGSGKSTLLKALILALPGRGRVLLDGRPLAALSARARARALCLLPQQEEGGAAFSVEDYVRLGRYPHLGWLGSFSALDQERVDWALEQAGCRAWRARRLGELSGGERQLVRLAAALAQESRILLLDEPAAFLDPGQRRRLWERLEHVLAGEGLSLVFVSHDVNEVLRRADRYLALQGGAGLRSGPVAELAEGDWLGDLYGLPLQAHRLPGQARPWLLERDAAPAAGSGSA